ncbi:MAG TPA: diaminopimelate epimerase [Gemmatimonadaceae bacterium]|nr:diaminopimelate epimerase [Gemmatimonadaceae bacterium]
MALEGLTFYKMSGSGNDFVVVADLDEPGAVLELPAVVQSMCRRGTGIGADGVVLLRPAQGRAAFRMIYFNADGSRASMCGNAALCSARLAVELGLAGTADFEFTTDSGPLRARVVDGLPEIDLAPVADLRPTVDVATEPGELRMGFTVAGVPHLVVRCSSVAEIDVQRRGGALRRDPRFEDGTNVDFVAPNGDSWAMRTFERGVEAETLACGTGAVSSALLLSAWGETGEVTWIRTSSGQDLRVRLERASGKWQPSLSGEGRIVYTGRVRELVSSA